MYFSVISLDFKIDEIQKQKCSDRIKKLGNEWYISTESQVDKDDGEEHVYAYFYVHDLEYRFFFIKNNKILKINRFLYLKRLHVDAEFEIVNEEFPDKTTSIFCKFKFCKDDAKGYGCSLGKLSVIIFF